jgi:hypothetical protein
MPSKRETVLGAVKALVVAALSGAEVKRNLAKPERIPPGGLVVIRDGEPGEPDVTLSPVSYLYTHRIPVEIAAFESAALTREQVLDEMLAATAAYLFVHEGIGAAVAGNPWHETQRRKPSKAGNGRLERAAMAYERLRGVKTNKALPSLPMP